MPRAKKPRKAPESPRLPKSFDRSLLPRGPRRNLSRWVGLGSWTREAIAAAVQAQILGKFKEPVRLQRAMLREPAIFAASENRLAPHRGLTRTIKPPKGAPPLQGSAASVLAEALASFTTDASVALQPSVLSDDIERLAFHALYVDQVVWHAREDGSREDPYVIPWDMEAVEWSEVDRMLIAITDCGRVPIEHGDGRWIVGRKHADLPWRRGAIIALGTIWPDLAFARRDRSLNAQSHGDDKWIGFTPEGVALEDPIAEAMLDEMERLYEPQRAALFPNGSTVKRDQSASQNWQIFKEALESDHKAAQWILLGQDGTMTNSGGNYIKALTLFGVRNDLVESDFSATGAATSTGLLRPWSLINFGRWDRLEFQWELPDADADARHESIAKRTDAFNKAVKELRENGFRVTQADVDRLAKQYGIDPPTLAPSEDPAAVPAPAGAAPAEPTSLSIHRKPLRAAGGV